MTKKVIIASKNKVKIKATKLAFEKMFPSQQFEFLGVSVPSNVAEQPTSNKETITGAHNRADNAKTQVPNADYWIGIEGGIEKVDTEMMCFAWIVIKSNSTAGKARTGTFYLPKKVSELIDSGKELGETDDIVFGIENSKQKNGSVGILTENIIDRTNLYTHAIILALIPFKNQELY